MTSRLRDAKLIYECFVELSGPTEDAEAQIRCVYPRDYEWEEDIRKQIPKFTFPTRTPNETEEHFTFVFTDLDSHYRFGFCRSPRKGESCLCFISDLPWFKVFYRSLDKISDLRLDHQDELVEPFLAGLYSHPIPNLGMDTVLSVVPQGMETGQVYSFPLPNPKRLPEIPTDDNFTQFYTNLHYNVILHLFSNLIFERRIIITSSSLSLLSATVHGVVPLIFPLHWQHIFIPITPPHLLEYCAAPMPFLMGIHSSYMDVVRRMPIDDVVLVDVDESVMESPHVQDLEAIPSDIITELKHVLKKQASAYGDTVARSFLRAQVSMIGGYRSALKLRPGEKDVVFDEEQFLRSRPNSEEFLENLLHFQHFRQFMNDKIDKLKTRSLERDRFDEEVMMYEESTDKYKANLDKFISSTSKLGDQIKESSGKLGRRMRKQAKIVWKKLDAKQHQHQHHPLPPSSKTNSLPMHKSATESMLLRSMVTTPPLPINGGSALGKVVSRKPPSVIPYHRHKEGKQKLADILRLQNSGEPATGNLVLFTPPGTPRSSVASGDQSERVSLDSRASTDISMHSGDVAIGTLIDISASPTIVVLPQSDDEESVSSASSSDPEPFPVNKQQWETFDDLDTRHLDTRQPPLLPPRTELPPPPSSTQEEVSQTELLTESTSSSNNPFRNFDYEAKDGEQTDTFNLIETDLDKGVARSSKANNIPSPFESLHLSARPQSPFDDFSSSVAEALVDTSQDSSAANVLTIASQDLANIVEDNDQDLILTNSAALDESSPISLLPQPLVPTTTTAAPTQDIATDLLRGQTHIRKASAPPTMSSTTAIAYQHSAGYHASASAPTLPVHTGSYTHNSNPFYHGYQQMTYSSKNLQRPSGPRSPKFAQDIPLSIPQVPLNCDKKRPPPPPRPQPYSGEQKESLNRDDPLMQRLASIGEFNPFESLIGAGGMEAYVQQNISTNDSPLV